MLEGAVPPNWAELVCDSTEIATDEHFDVAKMKFEGTDDPSEISHSDVILVSQESNIAP